MPNTKETQTETTITEAQKQRVKEWNAMIRQKHSVPENYCVMIDRSNIDLVIDSELKCENIPVYDEWGTLCNCSFGIIVPACSEKYEGGDVYERVARWKAAMRQKYDVPDEYEVVMFYYEGNDIEHWIANCEQKNRIVVKDPSQRLYARSVEGGMHYMPSKEEYIHSLPNSICSEHGSLTQHDSDRLGHFLQVVTVLLNSAWFKHKDTLQCNMNRDGKTRADMPSLEQTAFALLYVRQLIDSNDDLINIACNIYCRFCSNTEKREYVKSLKKNLNNYLYETPRLVSLATLVQNNMELIEVFQYGALILHQPDNIHNSKVRNIFKTMYLVGNERVHYIFELNDVLKQIVCQASSIAVFIQKDFGTWIAERMVPAPDVMWQNNMFTWDNLLDKNEDHENITRESFLKFRIT